MNIKIKSKIIFFFTVVFIFSGLITGCKKETGMLPAFPVGIAVDKLSGDDPIAITLEIVNTKAAAKTDESSGKPSGSVYEESKGKSFGEAIENLSNISSVKVDFSHNAIVILSKELCESGISDVMDYLFRDREFRTTNWLLVAEDSARDIIKSSSPNEDINSIGLFYMLTAFEKNNTIVPVDLNSYTARANRVSKSSYIPFAYIDKSEGSASNLVRIDKMAIFKKNKMVDILSKEESKSLMWLSGNRKGHMIVQLNSGKTSNNVTLDVMKQTAKIIPDFKNGQIKFQLNFTGYGVVREIGSMEINPETIKKIEHEVNQTLKKQLTSLIDKSQKKLNADFIGFAEAIYNNNPKLWLSIENNWDSIYPNVEYEINFDIKIKNVGITKDKFR